MKRLSVNRALSVLALLAGFSHVARSDEALEVNTAKPNFVIFVADDMGWGDSATYGNDLIQTPNMDRLASFER